MSNSIGWIAPIVVPILVYVIGFSIVWKFVVSAVHNIIQTWIIIGAFLLGLLLFVSSFLAAFSVAALSKQDPPWQMLLFLLISVFIIIIPMLYVAKLTKEVNALKKKMDEIESNNH